MAPPACVHWIFDASRACARVAAPFAVAAVLASAATAADPAEDGLPHVAARAPDAPVDFDFAFVEPDWRRGDDESDAGFVWTIFEEAEATPGRPAFRVEAALDVPPRIAASTLMDSLGDETPTTPGERRKLLERSSRGALVHTYVDLPFMFSDREVVIRIEHRVESESGIHHILWRDANEVLPPPEGDVLRLGTSGFWRFHPEAPAASGEPTRTRAIYVTRAEVGGSLPRAVGDRLMRRQAVDAMKRIQRLIARRAATRTIDVAAPVPEAQRGAAGSD